MRVALAQIAITGSLAENQRAVEDAVVSSAASGADVIVLPECALTGYLGFEVASLGDLDPKAIHDAICSLGDCCRRHNIATISGQYFKRGGVWYNNAVAISREGRLLASYDKCQLVDTDCYEVAPGGSFPVFDLDGARCSMAICHDIRYPEILRQYGKAAVQVHFHLFYGMRHRSNLSHQAQYDAHLTTRAVENGLFIAAANVAVDEQMVRSQLVDLEGLSIVKAPSWHSNILIADIDPNLAGDGWAQKRRDDLFDDRVTARSSQSYFERAVWERKPYMINHDISLRDDK